MKSRTGFVSNSSSSSFVLKKHFMGDEEEKDFRVRMDEAEYYETIGETENFFFGIIDNDGKFYRWLENKHFIGIEWDEA